MSRFETVCATLEAEMAKPYAYGIADCFFTGLAMIDALQGTDYQKTYAGRYTTLAGAQKALRQEGHKTLVTFFEGLLAPCAPAQAYLGDICIIALPVPGKKRMAEHVGVHDGRRFIVKTDEGRKVFEYTDAIAAFRV
jgi:hypothetical protein